MPITSLALNHDGITLLSVLLRQCPPIHLINIFFMENINRGKYKFTPLKILLNYTSSEFHTSSKINPVKLFSRTLSLNSSETSTRPRGVSIILNICCPITFSG